MNVDLFLPLQEPTFYILLSLRGGEKHGYAILKDCDPVERQAGEAIDRHPVRRAQPSP